jgi:hypothetical protein
MNLSSLLTIYTMPGGNVAAKIINNPENESPREK